MWCRWLGLAVIVASACRGSEERCGTGYPGEAVIRVPGASIAKLVEHPTAYDGKIVRVTGDVARVFGTHGFLLRGQALLSTPFIGIVSKNGSELAVHEDMRVRVVGTVQQGTHGGAPIIVARSVESCAS